MNRLINLLAVFVLIVLFSFACKTKKELSQTNEPNSETIQTNLKGKGLEFEVHFTKGEEYNHPLMAIWAEDMNGNYIQTLYIAKSIATGTFEHVKTNDKGIWEPGPVKRLAALPYWAHKRGVKEADGTYLPSKETAIPDAYSGATPQGSFVLKTKTDDNTEAKIRILFEINQSWDWNEYWTNSKYPDDIDYKTSSQPSVIYEAVIDPELDNHTIKMKAVGHGHYSGKDGSLTKDLSTLTTALKIVENIQIKYN